MFERKFAFSAFRAGQDRRPDRLLPDILVQGEGERRHQVRAPQEAKRRPDQRADSVRAGVRAVRPAAVHRLLQQVSVRTNRDIFYSNHPELF